MRSPVSVSGTWLVAAICVYLGLTLPNLDRQGVGWDEQVDLMIASAYSSPGGSWRGATQEPNQTRLPMYLGSYVLRSLGGIELHGSRLMSVAVAVLILIGVWIFCGRELDPASGVVSCLLLATSPYFLAFSKVAFTEGDVYITCAAVWVLILARRLDRRLTIGSTVLLGAMIGVSVSMKFFGVALIPAVVLYLVTNRGEESPEASPIDARWSVPLAGLGLSLLGVLLWFLELATHQRIWPGGRRALVFMALFGLLWLSLLVWGWKHRAVVIDRRLLPIVIGILAIATFFVVPPVHTTNPAIATALISESAEGGTTVSFGQYLEMGAFHFLVVLIKPSLAMGLLLWLSLVAALLRARQHRGTRLLVLAVLFYFGFLVVLPLAQTRYMMPVLVMLTMLLSDSACRAFRAHRIWVASVATVAGLLLALDLVRVYPDYSLSGYPLVGERYLAGRSTVGYRSIVQTPSDGIEQALRWADEFVEPDERLVMFVRPGHIVRAILPEPRFELANGLLDSPELDRADYVLTSINAEIEAKEDGRSSSGSIYRYPYDREQLEQGFEPVFVVTRAFGLEVAAVWRRRPGAS